MALCVAMTPGASIAADTPSAVSEPAGEAPSPTVPPDAVPPATAAPDAPAVPVVTVPVVDAEQIAKAAAAAQAEAAAKAEAEHREKREQAKKAQMAEAEEFVHFADLTVTNLPYPLNILLGVSFLGITLWRYLAGVALLLLALGAMFMVSRRFRSAEAVIRDPSGVGGVHLAADVILLALRNPLKVFVCGLLIRGINALLVTSLHPDILWISDMVLFLGGVLYFYDLAALVDLVYGGRIFHINNRLMGTVRPIVLKGVRFAILFFAGMHIYQDVTGQTMVSVLAGLGIGGLALALASQETLKNLLGFASIAFDKAFLVGDQVSIGDFAGTVEHVGLRSMRIRTYDGRCAIIPNNTAINSNIINLTRRPYIRREIRIALSPSNPYAKIEEAMARIGEVVGNHDGKVPGLPPVVRFVDFEPARFVIQVLFWYDAEKSFFYDECSRINLEVARVLSEAGVVYAER